MLILLNKKVYALHILSLKKNKQKKHGFENTALARPSTEYIWATLRQNQQNGMCTQRRLRSAWASAQSDQSLRYPNEDSLGP